MVHTEPCKCVGYFLANICFVLYMNGCSYVREWMCKGVNGYLLCFEILFNRDFTCVLSSVGVFKVSLSTS